MSEFDFDLFVIGAGSGGVRAARFAAGLGGRVAICESGRLGGTCVNVGCVPKKLFMYGSRYAQEAKDAHGFGWSFPEPDFNWSTLLHNKNREIHRLNGIYQRLLDNSGATLIRGRGKLTDPHTVEVDGTSYTARYILICTGGHPFVPPIPGHELGVHSDQIFYLDELPRKIVIVGGGYIGVEFACIFNGYGVDVSLVHRNGMLLNQGFDDDVRLFLDNEMRKLGIENNLGCTITEISKNDDGSLTATLDDRYTMKTDMVMWAAGRRPNTKNIGLDAAGVALTEWGHIKVDEYNQTNVEHIYACGDVIGKVELTPVATQEGMQIARNLFGDGPKRAVDYQNIPTAVFSNPNLATVGLTEHMARKRYKNVDIYRTNFKGMKHAMTGRDTRTLMKLVVDKDTDRVLGCHMVGPNAGEIIQGFAVALKAGATKDVFDRTIGIHPTAAEEFVTMRTPVPVEAKAASK
ncbi:MAG: glutathione-disulfide reductase [Myxococcota bacterium]